MFLKELSIRGKKAQIVCHDNRSVRIECDGLNASLRELQMLRLKMLGLSAENIATHLGIDPGYVRNQFMYLKRRNTHIDGSINHLMEIINKARELELLKPIAHDGLLVLMGEGNAYHRSRKKALKK